MMNFLLIINYLSLFMMIFHSNKVKKEYIKQKSKIVEMDFLMFFFRTSSFSLEYQ